MTKVSVSIWYKRWKLISRKTNDNCGTTVTICLVWLVNNNETCCEQQGKSNCKCYDRKQLNPNQHKEKTTTRNERYKMHTLYKRN